MKFLLTVLLSLLVTISSTPTIAKGCFQVESEALLTFKAGLNDPGNLTSSWHGQDCCNWSGVTCDQLTKHVVKLNLRNPYVIGDVFTYYAEYAVWLSHALSGAIKPALLSLRYLTHLDLSNNGFSNNSIPKFIGSFENLVYLNLSGSGFTGVIPYELGNLSRLQFLDLSLCDFTGSAPAQIGNLSDLRYLSLFFSYDSRMSTTTDNVSWVFRLTNLRYMDLSSLNLWDTFNWLATNEMHRLETLNLYDCSLSDIATDLHPVNLTSLTELRLSGNSFNTPLPHWLCNITSLLYLDLSWSKFTGSIPRALANLASLNSLSISGNNFDPAVDIEPISKLHNLRSLDLGSLVIGGDISSLIEKLGSMWYNLEFVYLNGNNLSGKISSWIAPMKNLSIIDLSSNLLSGHISTEIGLLMQLRELYLYDNSLSGVITENHFVNLSNLRALDLSDNMLTMKINDKWVPPFQLQMLSLSPCKVGPSFPSWIRGQTQLSSVQLSNTSITGAIPTWFWNIPVESVDLSGNKITKIEGVNLTSSNDSGRIPSSWSTLGALDLSRNQIKGTIPYDICEMINLYFLDISNNALCGEIPSCWKSDSNIMFMDLSNNQITGQLPLSIGSFQNLFTLQLDHNKLHGEVPSTLQRCNSLQFLSLGRNNFSGKIPPWIGKQLQKLVVLQLCSNKFTGYIPLELGELSRLHIMDLSHNLLVGTIACFVGSFYGMRNSSSNYSTSIGFGTTGSYLGNPYEVTLYIDINGQKNYTSMPLRFAKTIDISGNNLSGHVPDDIWLLQGVINLNLSKNNFMGEIPEAIGGMRALESLDLSLNNFSGPIPQALSSLSSLHSLNLSYNNFSGKIPTGRQLDTISVPLDYIGNPFLCGAPIGKSCDEVQTSGGIDIAHGDNESEMVWLYLVIALGFVLGFWSLWGVLIFINAWKVTYFQMVDKLFDKIYVHTVLAMRSFA